MAKSRFSVASTLESAARLWRPLAGQGEAEAQYRVRKMYHKAPGRAAGRLAGRRVYRKAADQGYAKAQTNLG